MLQSARQLAHECKAMSSADAPLLQVYKPELGPLDQRVTLSWLDGILEGEINLEDTEYWFTEPEGLSPAWGADACALATRLFLCMSARLSTDAFLSCRTRRVQPMVL